MVAVGVRLPFLGLVQTVQHDHDALIARWPHLHQRSVKHAQLVGEVGQRALQAVYGDQLLAEAAQHAFDARGLRAAADEVIGDAAAVPLGAVQPVG